jgi:CO/xanthine dehydrogenase Mo-binding subunit
MRASAGAANGIGQPVRRKEDFRLLTGRGRYGDDLALPRMVHAAFVRSPHAHARIHSVDKSAALAVPGALAVLAGADYVADGLKPIPHNAGSWSRPIWLCAFAAWIRSHPRIGRYRSKRRVSSAKA